MVRLTDHYDSGRRCLVAHFSVTPYSDTHEIRTPLPQCVICKCGQHLRPEEVAEHFNPSPDSVVMPCE